MTEYVDWRDCHGMLWRILDHQSGLRKSEDGTCYFVHWWDQESLGSDTKQGWYGQRWNRENREDDINFYLGTGLAGRSDPVRVVINQFHSMLRRLEDLGY